MSKTIMGSKLITPSKDVVEAFNSFWTPVPQNTRIQLFKDGELIEVKEYISEFANYEKADEDIRNTTSLKDFLEDINKIYHTRVRGISEIITKLADCGIETKEDLERKIKNGKLSPQRFIGICKEAMGSYTYSFATKVFSFVEEQYPIVDSIVVTLLNEYEYKDKIVPKSKWGDYSLYIKNYEAFEKAFELDDVSRKKIDKFLWTYGKILEAYWIDMGVLRFETVSFNPKT